jgi:hypothetical protein
MYPSRTRALLAYPTTDAADDSSPERPSPPSRARSLSPRPVPKFRRYAGHLARDGREHAIRLLDGYAAIQATDVQDLDVGWTPQRPIVAGCDNGNTA